MMGWRVVHLSKPCKITIETDNLALFFYDEEQAVHITLADIDFILFDSSKFSISGKALERLANKKIATLFIDDAYHPSAILTPYHQHSTMSEIAYAQIALSKEFKEIVWQKIIYSKIFNQMQVLKFFYKPKYKELEKLLPHIKLYDKNQDEAQAARLYWKALFDMETFRREQGSEDIINMILNYAYAIIRAACARDVSTSGMLGVFGIWHKNRYNAFALVDDLIEPFRPICDIYVKKLFDTKYKNATSLTTPIKRDLIALLNFECVRLGGGNYRLSSAISEYVTRYKTVMISGEINKMLFPTIDTEFFNNERF